MSRAQHRDLKKEQFWREAVAAWQKSGQSVRAFCAARALAEHSFYSCRRELAHRAQAQAKPPSRPKLVPVRVVADRSAIPHRGSHAHARASAGLSEAERSTVLPCCSWPRGDHSAP
jgi:hypothetical protein